MPCKYGKPSGIFTKFVTEDSLRSEHVRELFLKNKDLDTAALVVSQLFLLTSFDFLGFSVLNQNMLQSIKDTLIQICVTTHFYQNVCSLKAAFVSCYSHKHKSGRPVYCFISRCVINVLFQLTFINGTALKNGYI